MTPAIFKRVRRGLAKPPHVIARRVAQEIHRSIDRAITPWRSEGLSESSLLRRLEDRTLDDAWARLSLRPYLAWTGDVSAIDVVCPADRSRILSAADAALAHRVDLLGSGVVELGPSIDWHTDFKTNLGWPKTYAHDIDYLNLDRPSDVKVPWELSRLQWLMPAGQAFRLTGDERYALAVREVLDSWIRYNPCPLGPNWACTMEAAMRIFTWTWFFHTLHSSQSWREPGFRLRFLGQLIQHADFTFQYLEYSDVNGNHCTADAAGLVIAGLFFGEGRSARKWLNHGWQLLCDELPKQVTDDGVDFEASAPYHRLVQELFFLAALARERAGLSTPPSYRERVLAMARFTAAYSRPDGTAPNWGDGDDARTLPFGGQAINDHRYLIGQVGAESDDAALLAQFSGDLSEVLWLLGPDAARSVQRSSPQVSTRTSQAFCSGGAFVMRHGQDHVFVDCGPIGLAGRGGHGHNDCLSFEAMLDGVMLVVDCGSYVYTASAQERNLFRSSSCHNTPIVDHEELNRFISPTHLWNLHYDAKPSVDEWRASEESTVFQGSHSGYCRLARPVVPRRRICLRHARHELQIRDEFEGEGAHLVQIPLHLAPGVAVDHVTVDHLSLKCDGRSFDLTWESGADWRLEVGTARFSPRYGVAVPIVRLQWSRSGALRPFEMRLAPSAASNARTPSC